MVFGVQKVGFCIAKVWFLFFECYVVANRSQRISWLNVNISQSVCHIIPISQQRCWQTVSSRRGRFIVPAYPYTPTKWGTEMRVRLNKCKGSMK